MITLYRGDDTTFKGVKRLRVTIESKESLAGCSATFEVCGVVKHVPDVSTGSFYLSLTGEDTAKMPLGTHTATLRVYDDESRRRTVANTIMVCVTERIGDAYPGEEDIAVSLGAMVEWRNVSDKPSVNGVVLEGNKTTKELGIKGDGWLSRPRHASSIRRVRPASGRGKDSHDTAFPWCRHRLPLSSAACDRGARRAEP